MNDLPLGKPSDYPDSYDPGSLVGIARADARKLLGIKDPLPFSGVDCWRAWELTWLDCSGLPQVATAELLVDAASPRIVESKSLKLYLHGFSFERFASADDLAVVIGNDLGRVAGSDIDVRILPTPCEQITISPLPGRLIDGHAVDVQFDNVNPSVLQANDEEMVNEILHSHLFRSVCPVTGQPDFASVVVDYRGPRIDETSLLRYLVSYRRHSDFHEACVERIFQDIFCKAGCEQLTVAACFTRRGGIDINPLRSSEASTETPGRSWRQ